MAEADIRTVSVEDLARLKRDRHEADARYNEALAGVDAAVLTPPDLPHPPPGPDEQQISPLNAQWDILEHPPAGTGWRGRLTSLVWGVVAPVFAAQQRFNATLVDHVNRSVPRERAVTESIASAIGLVRHHLEASATFQSRLVVFLQQITPFVDTKDYEFAGLARRSGEDAQVALARLDDVAKGLAGGLSGLSDEVLKRYETLVTRDRREDDRLADLRTAVATLQQTTLALKRELARLAAHGVPEGSTAAAPGAAGSPPASSGSSADMLAGDRLQSQQYAGFEDLFRGSELLVSNRLTDYVPIFTGGPVLDVGCGRGEMLALLAAAGIEARGADLNHEMVERCRARGLTVVEADALTAVAQSGPGSLGGLLATQVVEHLEPNYLMRLLAAAADALRPGAPILLETINPACWSAFFDSYVRDLTHVQPIHPDTLKFLVTAAGFVDATILWRSPYPENGKLERLPEEILRAAAGVDPALKPLVDTVNRNVDRLNGLFFGYRDYAVVATRP